MPIRSFTAIDAKATREERLNQDKQPIVMPQPTENAMRGCRAVSVRPAVRNGETRILNRLRTACTSKAHDHEGHNSLTAIAADLVPDPFALAPLLVFHR